MHLRDWRWAFGAVVLLCNWPFTLVAIMPTNRRLEAIAPQDADAESRALVVKWGGLHAVRSVLGGLSTLAFLWASIAECEMKSGRIRVGVGGWSFRALAGQFLSARLPQPQELSFASRKLSVIEINATFYRTQTAGEFSSLGRGDARRISSFRSRRTG